MTSVGALLEKLLDSPASSVPDVGAQLQNLLTADDLPSRYIAQVAERALNEEYETIDEVVATLQDLIDRDPPIVEPKRELSSNRLVLPEVKVLQAAPSSIQALVTSGPLRDSEIEIKTNSPILPYLWVHASLAA